MPKLAKPTKPLKPQLIDDLFPTGKIVSDPRFLEEITSRRRAPVFKSERVLGEFPQLIVTVPDEWSSIKLAPLYDVHCGHGKHDAELFRRHKAWIMRTPNVLTWNGGDFVENASKLSVGAGVYEQDYSPQNQFARAALDFVDLSAKMMFSIPGNHEARCSIMGVDVAQWCALLAGIEYFHDYVFLTIRWRGQHFRILVHHGSGAAQTAGAQTMAARKDMHWANADIFWTGHLHSSRIELAFRQDYDQRTNEAFERDALIIISPSYLRTFGTYAAAARYPPGIRGLTVVELQEDGRMDVNIHARGKRL